MNLLQASVLRRSICLYLVVLCQWVYAIDSLLLWIVFFKGIKCKCVRMIIELYIRIPFHIFLKTLLLHDCSTYISSNETSILHICLNYLGKLMKREHSFETEKTFYERKWYINYEISNVKVYKVANTFGLMKKTVYIVYISWAMQARFPT